MRKAVVGLLAHVDSGKTTLAEALLYSCGAIRSYGRVDHGNTFLDFEPIERERGITVFSKLARLEYEDMELVLVDTPGHVDFSAEAERTLQVLDLAVLVVAANEPVRAHTRTLWRLLRRYNVPTIVFVNKIDLVDTLREEFMHELAKNLDEGCFDVAKMGGGETHETLSMTSEKALEEYVRDERLSDAMLQRLFGEQYIFPCVMGSALKQQGIIELLKTIDFFVQAVRNRQEFGARAFKVSHGNQNERLVWLKVTSGKLRAKDTLRIPTLEGSWTEKVNQVRKYSGSKYELVQEVAAGDICAVTGLDHAECGVGLGIESAGKPPLLRPALTFAVEPHNCDAHKVYEALCMLQSEDPLLGVLWNEEAQQSQVQLLGEVQLEVLRTRLNNEQGFDVGFGTGALMYEETISAPIAGVGHFEPLRHYAEVHVLLEPLPRGSGVKFGTVCKEDDLDRNWQRLILTNAMERPHRGVLIGAPLTDVRITLLAGRAHPKHTEGGDFRQATYRAIRQALMQAQSVLLEPWYEFELEVPTAKVGRALSDLQSMAATFGIQAQTDTSAIIVGRAPVATIGGYALSVSTYTAGQGSLSLLFGGYDACHDAERVVADAHYDPEADLAHTPDSVFCSHGAGYTVKWHDVVQHAHVTPEAQQRRPWVEADEEFFSTSR